jgi:hypothetical protein
MNLKKHFQSELVRIIENIYINEESQSPILWGEISLNFKIGNGKIVMIGESVNRTTKID